MDPLVLSPMIVNWLLNPYKYFEPTFSTSNTFQVQLEILTEIYDKRRVYEMLKAEFRFFLVNFMPFLNFRIGVGTSGHVAVTIKKQRD